MEVLGSALRHGVDPENIRHALLEALAVDQVGEDPSDTSSWDQTGQRTCSSWSSWTDRTVPPLSMPCARSTADYYPEGDEPDDPKA